MCFDIGSSFLNKQTDNLPSHLWFVISYPYNLPKQIIIVNLTSWKTNPIEPNDKSCILNVGDHDFVQHKSYIKYREARRPVIEKLHEAREGGLITFNQQSNMELLERILDGAINSQYTPLWVINILQHQKLI